MQQSHDNTKNHYYDVYNKTYNIYTVVSVYSEWTGGNISHITVIYSYSGTASR